MSLDGVYARGELLLVGAFADPQVDGSMGILVSEEGPLEFVEGDPSGSRASSEAASAGVE